MDSCRGGVGTGKGYFGGLDAMDAMSRYPTNVQTLVVERA